MTGDTVITSAVHIGNYIFCRKGNHKLFVMDTCFNLVDTLTTKYTKYDVRRLFRFHDTAFLETPSHMYFFDSTAQLYLFKSAIHRRLYADFDDSAFTVYSCSAGEWGGAIFFIDKETNKTFSYPATGVQQVLKFNNEYVVSNFLAHMWGISDYLYIHDPRLLYELVSDSQKHFCNWYTSVDSLKKHALFKGSDLRKVNYYRDTFVTRTLTTFPYDSMLYSIYCTDSATILAKHENHKLIAIDTLLKKQLVFTDATTNIACGHVTVAYRHTWGIGWQDSATKQYRTKDYQNTGLIDIKHGKITFLEFNTPHMRDY